MRARAIERKNAFTAALAVGFAFVMIAAPAVLAADSGGAAPSAPQPGEGGGTPAPPKLTTPAAKAQLTPDGHTAVPPASAPDPVKNAIYAANEITRKPYRYGGGHRSFKDSAYDCSGTVSYALHGGDLLNSPLDSVGFFGWGERGPGQWITVYASSSHAYVVIAGLRLDTSGPGPSGPRWRRTPRSGTGFRTRHPDSL